MHGPISRRKEHPSEIKYVCTFPTLAAISLSLSLFTPWPLFQRLQKLLLSHPLSLFVTFKSVSRVSFGSIPLSLR